MQIKLFKFNPVKVNTYLIYDEKKKAILIDCGASTKEEYMELKEFTDFYHLKLEYLINTHLHFDHTLGNHFVYETYGLRPQYHQLEEFMIDSKVQSTIFEFPMNYQSTIADHYINEGDTIVLSEDITLKVLLTPGHSPGSLSFYCKENDCVFTGDALFYHNIGRTDLLGGDQNALITSITNKIFTLPNNTKIFPGHGQFSTVEEEKQCNPYI